jgi:hypothetical protein
MNEALWDNAYRDMQRAFATGESLVVGSSMLPYAAVIEHVMLDDEVRSAHNALMKQDGAFSVMAYRDLYKHKCAKTYANWVIYAYEQEHRNEDVS